MIRTLNTLLIFIFVAGGVALAQQDDVVQITTELVQTGVTFLDKQGRLVDGLKKEDFELRVDGRVVPISFFENIVAGSQRTPYGSSSSGRRSALHDRCAGLDVRRARCVWECSDGSRRQTRSR